jgi:tRNA-splicing endonuclease subunit Sen54
VTENAPATLPRRGEKDFEPNPTVHQSDVLASSREAMHNAIAHTRLHPRKTQIIGVYAPNGPVPPWVEAKPALNPKPPLDLQDLEDEELDRHVKQRGAMDTIMNAGKEQKVMGIPADACVYVSSPKGQLFNSVGKADSYNRVWLLPEEALYLLERGSLDIRWPGSMTSENAAEDDEQLPDNVPMTLQAAYACLIGRSGLSLERFSVYTGLKRLGYVVIRSPTWDNDHADIPISQEFRAQTRIAKKMTDSTFLTFMRDSLGGLLENDNTTQGPMIGLSSFRNYSERGRRMSPGRGPKLIRCLRSNILPTPA